MIKNMSGRNKHKRKCLENTNVDSIPDKITVKQYKNYLPLNTEVFAVCELDFNKCSIRNASKHAIILFTSESYRECISFANSLRREGNLKRLLVYNLFTDTYNNYFYNFVREYDRGRSVSSSLNNTKVQNQYLKDNQLGEFSKDDGLLDESFNNYMTLLNKNH